MSLPVKTEGRSPFRTVAEMALQAACLQCVLGHPQCYTMQTLMQPDSAIYVLSLSLRHASIFKVRMLLSATPKLEAMPNAGLPVAVYQAA